MTSPQRHRPAARIVANGQDITTRLLDDSEKRVLVSLTVTDEAGIKADGLELTIDNRDRFEVPPIGSEIEVWLGYEPAPVRMGLYRLDSWEMSGPPNVLTLSASSAELTTAIKGQKTRSWHDTTLGAIVRAIAGQHGLGVLIPDELAGRPMEHIDQQTESDLNFLSRLASRNGAVFKLADGKVLFTPKGASVTAAGEPKPDLTVVPAMVASWSVTESERGGHQSVVCHWMDHHAGKRKSVTVGEGKPVRRDKRLYRTEEEARAAAQATLGDLRRGKRDATLEMAGNTDVFAESDLTMRGFHGNVDGRYGVKSVSHTFDSSGFRTSVSLEVGGDGGA